MSRKFRVQEGEKIQILMMTSEDEGTKVKNDEILIGIIEPDGTQRYVSDARDFEHIFAGK